MRWVLMVALVTACAGDAEECKNATALTADECGRTDLTCYRCDATKLDDNGLPLDWFQCDDGRTFKSKDSARESLEWVQAYCAEPEVDPNAGCAPDIIGRCACDGQLADYDRCYSNCQSIGDHCSCDGIPAPVDACTE